MILVTEKDFSIGKVISSLKRRETGAIVSFLGTVRGFTGKEKVRKLEFEADERAAARRLEEIRLEAIRRFKIQDAAIVHRIGSLGVSENIVLISVSAPRRRDAFAACRYVLEELKSTVPIWKKEHTEKGARWVPAKRSRKARRRPSR
ncbi:MAG: molybdenum cofactor biosynthesis protein MoaE [Candidatus Brockarchaeota archaeon]|nr:molybdenum cofactor biosynthesis protein MoaE [Candidatus Brockarchaeota archaeon]